ncbi:MAG: ATP-binding protein [Draconibacterium sp.]|nr:ATP-binding protein [Draconibacterium sp.]
MEERLFENDKTELKFVHNDYSREVPPVVEIFSNRLVITSYGGLIEGLSQEEFFNGRSMPRNRELMRIFRALEFVEHLGSGMNRILRAYNRNIFNLSENFLEVVFPYEEDYLKSINQSETLTTDQVTPEVTPEVEALIMAVQGEMTRVEIQKLLGLKDEKHFRENYQQKSLKSGILEMTIPDKPKTTCKNTGLPQKVWR